MASATVPATPAATPRSPHSEATDGTTRAVALGLLGVAIFALTIPMTRLASGSADAPQLPATFVAFGRAAVAGVLAATWLAFARAPWPTRPQWRGLAATALGVVFGFPLLLGLAVTRVDAAHAAVVTGLMPLATAALGAWRLGQRPGLGFWACAGAGTALVVGYAFGRGGGRLVAADALLAGAVLAGAFGYVRGAALASPARDARAPSAPMAPERVIGWVLVASLPATLPLALWSRPAAPHAVAATSWLAFGYVAVFSMWLGFFAWYRALADGGVVRISQLQLLQPFLAVLFAWPLLGERPDAPTLAFAAAVVAVVALSRRMPVGSSASAASAAALSPAPPATHHLAERADPR